MQFSCVFQSHFCQVLDQADQTFTGLSVLEGDYIPDQDIHIPNLACRFAYGINQFNETARPLVSLQDQGCNCGFKPAGLGAQGVDILRVRVRREGAELFPQLAQRFFDVIGLQFHGSLETSMQEGVG